MKLGQPRINGKKVSRRAFLRRRAKGVPSVTTTFSEGAPLRSDVGAACHPDQVAEFNRRYRELGITGAHHEADGTLVMTSRRARNQVLQARALRDNDAGYGDHAGYH